MCFLHKQIHYLDHIIRPDRLEDANHTADAIYKLKTPTSVTEQRPFLELCNVFRRVVPNFANITSPLSSFLKKTKAKYLEPLEEDKL